MNIRIIQIGKTKDAWLQTGIDEYIKRLSPFAGVEIRELPDVSLKTQANPDAVREKEAILCLKHITPQDCLILLEETGSMKTSLEFSEFLTNLSDRKNIVFLIGGVYGTHQSLKQRADHMLSLSRMTFTHRMARLILVEQIYRAMMIANKRSYHV